MIVQNNGSIGDRWASTPGKSIWAILLLSEQRMHVQPEMFLNIEQQALQNFFMSGHLFVFDLEEKDNWQQATLSEFNRKTTDHAQTSKATSDLFDFYGQTAYKPYIILLTPNPKFIVINSRSNLFSELNILFDAMSLKLLAKSKYPSSFTL